MYLSIFTNLRSALVETLSCAITHRWVEHTYGSEAINRPRNLRTQRSSHL